MGADLNSLSGLLRAAYTELPEYDLETATANRDRWLRESRAGATADLQSAPTWKELTKGIPESTTGYADQQAHYRRFLRAVNATLGGEAPPDEVANAASVAFRALTAQPSEQAAGQPPDREALAHARKVLVASPGQVFGSRGPPEDQLRIMLSCHVPLAAWLKQHRGGGATGGKKAAARATSVVSDEARAAAARGVAEALGARLVKDFEAAAEAAEAAEAAAEAAAAAQEALVASQPKSSSSSSSSRPSGGGSGGGRGGGGGGGGGGGWNGEFDTAWLREQCGLHLRAMHAASGGGSDIEVDTLAATVLDCLASAKSDDALQGELLDMLGFEALDLIGSLLPRRATIVASEKRLLGAAAAAAAAAAARADGAGGGAGGGPATHGCAVTLNSASAKQREKQKRKEAQKQAKELKKGGEMAAEEVAAQLEWLARGGYAPAAQALRDADGGDAPKKESAVEAVAKLRSGAAGSGLAKALPEGTVRRTGKGWEEVCVPPTKSVAKEAQRRVPIAELPEYVQLGFKGVKELNQLQSAVIGTALYSNENMLVCAPTGAGKTNVAMLSIMQQVAQCMEGGVLHRDRLKVIYVAPMKALAQEVVAKFGKQLAPLGLQVREFTGDMQLTKREIVATQMIVTTPEKWDVVTRKGSDALVQAVGLLIIDEVHLLNDDRGPVIEALVARTLRLVESSQSMIRIVGLSATLPNYLDVALFLRVNPQSGLYHFGAAYRPVPLTQTFVGVTTTNVQERKDKMEEIAYDKALAALRNGKQVMVFVHARNDTVKTARALLERAKKLGEEAEFVGPAMEHPRYGLLAKEVTKAKSSEVKELFAGGFGIHHAGMLRPDRSLEERLFSEGLIRVLVCTATLAWGVNLPAHTVIIKGTQVYNAQKGAFVDLGMLDVMQIFGRAGRPQFDVHGEGIIITQHARLSHYLQLLTQQLPIESQFVKMLSDHLNAEVSLGTVTSVKEAVTWLSYTYLYVRMCRNPLSYGIPWDQKETDPSLYRWRTELVHVMAKRLDGCRMVRYHEASGSLDATDLGRTASHFYLSVETIERWAELMHQGDREPTIFHTLCHASEFTNIKVREEEMDELEQMAAECRYPVKGGLASKEGKTNVLMQAYIMQARVKAFALVSDTMFVAQSASRLARGLFEMTLARGWVAYAEKTLRIAKMLERRIWAHLSPLRQIGGQPEYVYEKVEAKRARVDTLREMSASDVGTLVSSQRQAHSLKAEAHQLPHLELELSAQPITRTVLRVTVTITADFEWAERHHGSIEPFWIWLEDTENEHLYHKELWQLHKLKKDEPQVLTFTIPLFEPLPPQYYVRAISDRWLGCEAIQPLPLDELVLPSSAPAHTSLLDLRPLPRTAVGNAQWEAIWRFSHFNPVQTQVFHTVFHTDQNVLVGAPTGSGKTGIAELAVMRLLRAHPGMSAVYVAPLKALVRERMEDWGAKFVKALGYKLQELTGDAAPDMAALQSADIIATTPEKWDGVSRHWQQRGYVRKVGLVIIDEIHLLGEERGPILEIIVSRMRYIASQTAQTVRMVGLSTAMANASDISEWLDIPPDSLFNFKPSVRPVPLEVHIAGFPGKHYCPRMATMNKPTYRAILNHSPTKPTLVFVSSRRQTRLTALDLIAFCSTDEREGQFLNMAPHLLEPQLGAVKDAALRHTLAFGVGIHHAGLAESDRSLVERLFCEQSILVLVCTSTLAWGVNFPAHLVVVKGTEYYDGKLKRYVDFPVTDVLQMMGRAGRPQYDHQGVAVILVHEPKKTFYRKFLYEPFPIESCLQEQLHDHVNAEVVGGTIRSKQDAVDFLTWTYFYRRLTRNPGYYHLEDGSPEAIGGYLSDLVESTLADLENAGCVQVGGGGGWDEGEEGGEEGAAAAPLVAVDPDAVAPLTLGRVCSYYYLKYTTVALFNAELHDVEYGVTDLPTLLRVLCDASEFDELPVRHNEEHVNAQMALELPWQVDERLMDSPHTKAVLLLQAHFCRSALPMSDYLTDLKSVLDQAVRVLQAMVDIAADGGWLLTALGTMRLTQMVTQARFLDDPHPLSDLPHMSDEAEAALARRGVRHLPQLMLTPPGELRKLLRGVLAERQLTQLLDVVATLPAVQMSVAPPKATLGAGEEASVHVTLHSTNLRTRRHAFAPRFPKPKLGGWWLVMGVDDELLALKRVHLSGRGTTKAELQFVAPDDAGEHAFDVYLVSDSYISLDQQHAVTVSVA